MARAALGGLAGQLDHLGAEIGRLERRILEWHRQDETSQRLATIPGIGPITASAMAASAPDPTLFKSGRQFAAWLGLTPRANSSGGKERQGGISKMGDSCGPASSAAIALTVPAGSGTIFWPKACHAVCTASNG